MENHDITNAQLATYLQDFGLHVIVDEGTQTVLTLLPSKQGVHPARFQVDHERQFLILVVPQLLQVPAPRRPEMGAALSHINYSTVLGKFGMDLCDGEVDFSCNLPYRGAGICPDQLAVLAGITGGTLTEFLPVLQRLCWTAETAETVLGISAASPEDEGSEGAADELGPETLRALLESLRNEPVTDTEEDTGDQAQSA